MNDASPTNLVRYDAMCRAIDAAFEVDEVKDIRDKAIALETYARQAKNVEAERQACEIRLRAERKAGHLTKQLEKAPGARTDQEPLGSMQRGRTKREALEAAGVTTDQAHRWEKLAGIPEDRFEAALGGPDMPTTSGILQANAPRDKVDSRALWLWGRLQDFERDGLLELTPDQLIESMLGHMRETTRRLAPLVAAWLGRIDRD